MEEIFIEAAKDEAAGIYLQYVILCTEEPHLSDTLLNKVYSLLVIKTDDTYENESVFVYDVSRNADRALEIARVMCQNTVTPCTVTEVLDDIL